MPMFGVIGDMNGLAKKMMFQLDNCHAVTYNIWKLDMFLAFRSCMLFICL